MRGWSRFRRSDPAVPVIQSDDVVSSVASVVDVVEGHPRRLSWEMAEQLVATLVRAEASTGVDVGAAVLAALAKRPAVIVRLDELGRRVLWHSATYAPAIAAVSDRLRAGEAGPVGIALASTHGDGRIRELAVQRILAQPSRGLVPFLVLRTSDWVRQVRDRARAGLVVLLDENPQTYLPAAAEMTVLVDGRLRGSFARTQLTAAALRAPRQLWDTSTSQVVSRATRRIAFEAVLFAHTLPVNELVHAAETDPDVWLRSRAAEAVCREAVWTTRTRHLAQLARCRHAEVRAPAVTGLVRAGQLANAIAFLDDPSALVRAVARYAADKAGTDPLRHYRDVVAADPTVLGAIDGLTETGTAADGSLLMDLLSHPEAKVRARALCGLRHLDAVPPADRLMPMLRDPSAAVIREATTTVRPGARNLPIDLLWNLLADDRPAVRRAGYRLLREFGTTVRTRAALLVAINSDPRLARRGIADATQVARNPHRHPWNQLATEPLVVTNDQAVELRALTRQAAHALGPETARELLEQLEHGNTADRRHPPQ